MPFTKEELKELARLKSMTPLDRLIHWIKERESIRLKKEAGKPKPWTTDPVLRHYRFCNVIRIEDKVSQWLLKNWYIPNKEDRNTLIAVVVARHINLPSTLELIGFPAKKTPVYAWFEKIKRITRNIQSSGKPAYNNAYMIRGFEGIDKIEMVIEKVVKPIYENPPALNPKYMKDCVSVLQEYWGLSSFLSGQVVADLRWCWDRKEYWLDKLSYAPIGPGSRRGMNRLQGRPIDYTLKQPRFEEELLSLISVLRKEKSIAHIMKRAEAIDIQNCLCESDKYTRTILGEGEPKQLYKGD